MKFSNSAAERRWSVRRLEEADTMRVIHTSEVDDIQWESMCALVRRCTSLKKVDIFGRNRRVPAISPEGPISLLLDSDQHYNCSLEHIGLFKARLTPRLVEIIIRFVEAGSRQWSLDFNSSAFDPGSLRVLIDALNDSTIRIVKLSLMHCPSLSEADAKLLLSAASRVTRLGVSVNSSSGRTIEVISQFLRKNDTVIKHLSLTRPRSMLSMNNEFVGMLVDSIQSNPTLQELHLYNIARPTFLNQKLRHILCDTSSVKTVCQSNHSLCKVTSTHWRHTLKPEVALNINSAETFSVNAKCRSKLRAFYFRGEFNTSAFADIDVKLMPNVLEFVTVQTISRAEIIELGPKDGYEALDSSGSKMERLYQSVPGSKCNSSLNGIYRIIRSCNLTEMMSFPSPEAALQQLKNENNQLKDENASLKRKIEHLLSGKEE